MPKPSKQAKPAKPKMGRPPIDPAEKRDVPIKAFVTAAEKERLEAAAKAAGRSLSDWLRIIGLAAVPPPGS